MKLIFLYPLELIMFSLCFQLNTLPIFYPGFLLNWLCFDIDTFAPQISPIDLPSISENHDE
jgi:hypothetical protein